MSGPLPLSLCVITRDAAAQLADCLASVPFASEVVVVDSGSRDDTVEIARRRGARVIDHEWPGFGAQKNFAVGQASHDWVLCLDADERLTPELAGAIRAALATGAGPRAPAAYTMARRNRFLGRWLAHGEGYPDWNVRLFDRRRARWTDDPVHENVVADGPVGRLAGDLLHASAESLDAYLGKQNRYTTLQAEAMHARGERAGAARLLLSPLVRFVRFYVVKQGFLDGMPGLVHIAIGCFNSFIKYAKLRAIADRDEAAAATGPRAGGGAEGREP
jgi:glycosyltransferase involved in cell wall biosynthesis